MEGYPDPRWGVAFTESAPMAYNAPGGTLDSAGSSISPMEGVQGGSFQSPGSSGKRKWDDGDRVRLVEALPSRSPVPLSSLQLSASAFPGSEPSVKRLKAMDGRIGTVSKNPEPLHGLTLPIWRRIFGNVPPMSLGKLLRVSRSFYDILDPTGNHGAYQPDQESQEAAVTGSQQVWNASRRKFTPGLPRNLPGKSDLEMWRLIRGHQCQICHERKPLCTGPAPNPWLAGPGKDGVRVIWLYGVRCCGPCLRSASEQVCLNFSRNTAWP